MPREKIDYSKSIIYKLVCNDLNVTDLYVGSTTRFSHRKAAHKSGCTNPNSNHYNYNVYQFIRANGDWCNWSMIEVEKYPCTDGDQLRTRERYWYEQLNGTLNKQVPNRSQKQWREQNKEHYKEYQKDHYEQNKERLKEYQKDHYEQNKEHKKDYYEQNKQTIREYKKDYYEQNKQTIKEQQAKPYTCACGSSVRTGNKSIHFRSIKHTKYIESIKQVQ